jgi:UDP-N-acetylglucosamine transferase subunit ALG13
VIFVSLGTQAYPFDRLLRGLDGVEEELVIQGGSSTHRPAGATWFDFLDFPQLVQYVRSARVVVVHAGVGSVMTALGEGKRAVVVPRLVRYREAVDDHQLHFARRMDSVGLVRLVEDPAELRAAVAETPEPPAIQHAGPGRLADDLRAYLEDLTADRPPVVS